MLSYKLYAVASTCLSVPIALYQAWKCKSWAVVPERLALYPPVIKADEAIRVWIHAASVGESISALKVARLLGKLTEQGCDRLNLKFTSSNVTARDMVKTRLHDLQKGFPHVTCDPPSLMPLDSFWVMRRFLDIHKPQMIVLIESELWPCMIHEASKRGIHIILLDARLSSKSIRNWQRTSCTKTLIQSMVSKLDAVVAQSDSMRDQLVGLGARKEKVWTAASLKFMNGSNVEGRKEPVVHASGNVWSAVSTHVGEDELVLQAHRQVCELVPDMPPHLVLVPRHVHRAKSILEMAFNRMHGRCDIACGGIEEMEQFFEEFTCKHRSKIFILDRMGVLPFVYYSSKAVFIGNSLVHPGGGHNFIEALYHVSPTTNSPNVILGPYVENFEGHLEAFLKYSRDGCGVLTQVRTVDELVHCVVDAWMRPNRASSNHLKVLEMLSRQSQSIVTDVLKASLAKP